MGLLDSMKEKLAGMVRRAPEEHKPQKETRRDVRAVVGGYRGVPENREVLEKLDKSYDEMVDTLKTFELVPKKLPTIEQVMEAVEKLSPNLLREIGQFYKPTLLIIPAGKRKKKIKAISPNGSNAYYYSMFEGNTLWGPESTKLKVTIVDGAPSMPIQADVPQNLEVVDKAKKYQAMFAQKGMGMITADEYLILEMTSLHRYRQLVGQGVSY